MYVTDNQEANWRCEKSLANARSVPECCSTHPLIINQFILLQSSLPQLRRYFKERQNNGHLPAKGNASNTPVN